jgi:hypothetical protein
MDVTRMMKLWVSGWLADLDEGRDDIRLYADKKGRMDSRWIPNQYPPLSLSRMRFSCMCLLASPLPSRDFLE